MDNLCDLLNKSEIADLSEVDFICLCLRALKLRQGNVSGYVTIILDMNMNASTLFAEISGFKRKGCFFYIYESPVDFISHVSDSESESRVEWVTFQQLKKSPIYSQVKFRYDMIKNKNLEYLICIMIDNVFFLRIISKDDYKNSIRVDHYDILNSLRQCLNCRCNGHNPCSPNREYEWARDELKMLKSNKLEKMQQ